MPGPVTFREIAPAALTGAVATYLTVPTNKILLILDGWLTNTHTAAVMVYVYAVPSGSFAAPANAIHHASLPAASSVPFTVGLNMAQGGTIQALASVAAVVGMRLAPREIPV